MPASPGSSSFFNLIVDHGGIQGLADDDHTQYPFFSTGTGTPVGAVTPQRVGHIYIDTSGENAWIATNTTNADWEQIDASGGGGGGGGPSVSTGAGAPSSTPSAEGDIYIDTTNDQSYMAVGTASSSDWKQTSNLPQGITSVSDDTSPTLGGSLDGGGFAITNIGNVDGRDISADGTKLDGIESGATADQTGAEIKTAYEAEANTNAYTDAEKTKLAGISAGAEVNAVDSVNTQTGAVVLDADDISDAATANKFTTAAEISKLAGIESGATADQTGAEIKTAYEAEANTNAFTDAEQTKLAGIAAGAEVNPDVVPQAEAEAGTATTERIWTAERVAQAIAALGGGGGGDLWSDAVDADIVPDADGTRDLGADATRFAQAYIDELHSTGGLLVTESADHTNTPAAGKGEFWVRNDAPCTPVFTDDDGVDHDLYAGEWFVFTSDGPTSGTTDRKVWMVVPYDCTVKQILWTGQRTAGADASNYWEIMPKRRDPAGDVDLLDTAFSTAGGLDEDTGYDLGTITTNGTDAQLSKLDVLVMTFTAVGTPFNWFGSRMGYSIHLQPR